MSDPVNMLVRALQLQCARSADIVLGDRRSDDWRTMLFDGGSHRFTLILRGNDIEGAIADIGLAIAAPDLCLPGHMVVDAAIETLTREADQTTIVLTARTIEDRLSVSA